jgi:hypothetical protein
MSRLKGLLLVTMEPPAGLEDEFNDWYDTEHFPQRRGLPGFETASRWVCIEGWPRWAALYDLESIEALDSPAYRTVSGPNSTPWSKRLLPRTIGRMRVLAKQVAPGDALTRPQDEVSRLLVIKYPCLAGSASIVDALASMAERYKGVLQLRVFRSQLEGGNDTWAIVEIDRPLGAASLYLGFSEVDGVSARLFNLYAPYFRG